jgi:hypothetical protein
VCNLIKGIEKIGKTPEIYKDACIERSKVFDLRVFRNKVLRWIQEPSSQ